MKCIQRSFVAMVIAYSLTPLAQACGPCEYSDSLGICWPYDKCVIDQVNPVTQAKKVVKLAQAIASGSSSDITQSLGDVLISSPNCLGCRSVAHTVLPAMTDAQINEAIGRGFLVYVGTGDPVLVAIDVASNLATEQKVKKKPAALPAPAADAPKERKPKTYSAKAECLIQYKDQPTIYAAWKEPASFTGEDGKDYTYPNIDLLEGDTLKISAPVCPTWHRPSLGQESITSAKFKFEAVSPLAGKPETIKWFVYGPKS